MKKHKFKSKYFAWPDKCAACGAKPTTKIESKRLTFMGVCYYFFFFTITNRIVTIRYPVCNKHMQTGTFAAIFTQHNSLNSVLGLFTAISLVKIGADVFNFIKAATLPTFNGFFLFSYIYIFIYLGLHFWALKNTPVRLYNATEKEIILSFTNESYEREFLSLNY
jgi:hypothetical protein